MENIETYHSEAGDGKRLNQGLVFTIVISDDGGVYSGHDQGLIGDRPTVTFADITLEPDKFLTRSEISIRRQKSTTQVTPHGECGLK